MESETDEYAVSLHNDHIVLQLFVPLLYSFVRRRYDFIEWKSFFFLWVSHLVPYLISGMCSLIVF